VEVIDLTALDEINFEEEKLMKKILNMRSWRMKRLLKNQVLLTR